ncbi:Tc toxin subunit A [Xenorhabdus bovienii]|uniref:Tc toxin subunit A n=1 Tax=Xenorhabdus bovienii TaxID=40576 RepID=UPI00237C6300|nr:Tc toxin subunit A [Xenorhabdus bovienii]MDE1484236.1 hypothetical protein [Xenorhabdus bovienii]MDE9433816.1 hypothetical protein [Xenorhabdus bovienii]MDE9443486.1 hypothetical protein [Xenorhabdus bovienii]MDE9491442.1 hypothetical protein [Xenorhabdus bovienii]MDE9507958.1 hypothetical protein [Xenorhabdus bovienii]
MRSLIHHTFYLKGMIYGQYSGIKNPPLTNSLAETHYPLALPFHFPLKQTIAVLAEKELPLLELIQQADIRV